MITRRKKKSRDDGRDQDDGAGECRVTHRQVEKGWRRLWKLTPLFFLPLFFISIHRKEKRKEGKKKSHVTRPTETDPTPRHPIRRNGELPLITTLTNVDALLCFITCGIAEWANRLRLSLTYRYILQKCVASHKIGPPASLCHPPAKETDGMWSHFRQLDLEGGDQTERNWLGNSATYWPFHYLLK